MLCCIVAKLGELYCARSNSPNRNAVGENMFSLPTN